MIVRASLKIDIMENQGKKIEPNQGSEEDKKNKNQAEIDSATHLEDEETNGVTTVPTPKEVKGSQPSFDNPNQGDAGHGKTVAPSED